MKKLIAHIKKQIEQKKIKEQQMQERFLKRYYSVLYKVNDFERVEIAYFLKAEQTVEDLKQRGLLSEVYRYIKRKGVKVEC